MGEGRAASYTKAAQAIKVEKVGDGRYRLGVRIQWPTEIAETAFFEKIKQLPKAKTSYLPLSH